MNNLKFVELNDQKADALDYLEYFFFRGLKISLQRAISNPILKAIKMN